MIAVLSFIAHQNNNGAHATDTSSLSYPRLDSTIDWITQQVLTRLIQWIMILICKLTAMFTFDAANWGVKLVSFWR